MTSIFRETLIRYEKIYKQDFIFSLKDILNALFKPSNLTQYYNKIKKSRSWSSLIDKMKEGTWITSNNKQQFFDGMDQYSILELLSAMEVVSDRDQIELFEFLTRIVQGIETYYLMHQNFQVLELDINDWGEITTIGEIYKPDHLPTRPTESKANSLLSLRDWWKKRSIPTSRDGIREILDIFGFKVTRELLNKNLGLSLTDHYWIKPIKSSHTWEQVNFLHNDFSEDLGNLLFGSNVSNNKKHISLMTPDNTSEGVLRKRWKIIDGRRYLIKGSSNAANLEVANEILASKICERLNIPHVSYELIKINNQYYCACPCFMEDHVEFISLAKILGILPETTTEFSYEQLIKLAESLGLENEQTKIDQMIVLDYLIVNSDRHLNNFGFFRDPVTLEWQNFAPLFDNGNSMWTNRTFEKFDPEELFINTKPFFLSEQEQISLVKDFSWLNLDKLDGIEDEYLSLLMTVNLSGNSLSELHPQLYSALRVRIEKLRHIINP